MNAIGYIRRSKKSDSDTVSLEAQEQKIRSYCLTNNLTCLDIVTHDGISGGKKGRFAVIEGVRVRHNAQAIVVYDLDRLSRDNAGLLDYLERVMTGLGVQLHETTTGRMDYETAEGRFMLQVRSAVNEFYRMQIKRKTKHALQHLKAAGRRYSNLPPFGYSHSADGRLIENAEEQRIIKCIRAAAERGLSVRRTVALIRSTGYDGRLGITTVYRQLQIAQRNLPSPKAKLPAHYFALPD